MQRLHSNTIARSAVLFFALCSAASASQLDFVDFSDVSSLTLNGSASQVSAGGQQVLRLAGSTGEVGTAYLSTPNALGSNGSFSASFQFRMSSANGVGDSDGIGGDGLTFILQNSSNTAIGLNGGFLGIDNLPIANSLAVEFDTFSNAYLGWASEINGNHIGIDLNGDVTSSVAVAPVATRMNDGQLWNAWVDYNGASGLLEIRLSDLLVRPDVALLSYSVNLSSVLGGSSAYIGFTAGTGSATSNHDIVSWTFRNEFDPIGAVPVPEPATSTLLVLGLGGLAMARRRRSI